MKALFPACCKRWLHSPYVRISLLFMLCGGILLAVLCPQTVKGATVSIDGSLFSLAAATEAIITVPIITALTQQELTDGVIRSKLIGYTRTEVFLSQAVTGAAYSALCSLLLFAPPCIRAADLLKKAMCLKTAAALAVILLFLPAVSVLCTAICMNLEGFAGAVLCIVLLGGCFFGGMTLIDLLAYPEYLNDTVYDGTTFQETLTKNPNYIEEPMRDVLNCVNHLNPFSDWHAASAYMDFLSVYADADTIRNEQIQRQAEKSRDGITAVLLGTVCFTVLTAGIGYAFFKRRNIR
ncbi:MAG: hypothetical protein K6E36_00385 [Oscillospiraceae bacterium]|nr:hypothetical protein [Oscillospiraceae bacterium]